MYSLWVFLEYVCESSAISELVGIELARFNKDQVYKIADSLIDAKTEIEKGHITRVEGPSRISPSRGSQHRLTTQRRRDRSFVQVVHNLRRDGRYVAGELTARRSRWPHSRRVGRPLPSSGRE